MSPPFDAASILRQAFELQQAGRTEDAARLYREILVREPDNPRALQFLGVLEAERGDHEAALAYFERAARVEPRSPSAYYNLGNLLGHLDRLEQALVSYDQAVALAPSYVEGWANRGVVLERLNRYPEALASYDRALANDPRKVTAHFNRGYVLTRMNRLEDALAAYNVALAISPAYAPALNNRGSVFMRMHRPGDALADFDRLVLLNPGEAQAHSNRGDALLASSRFEEALGAYRAALTIESNLATAHRGCGEALSELHRYEEAFHAYDAAFRLAPELSYLEGNRLHAKMHICDWHDLEAEQKRLIAHVDEGKLVAEPFVLLVTAASEATQARSARMFAADRYPPSPARPRKQAPSSGKIRIGYVSGEFREQATAYLTADLFECHDRDRFEIHAFATGANDGSAMRRRLIAAFDSFSDVGHKSDADIALLVEKAGIDILVNLNGYFGMERTGAFSQKPAPTQVNFLGFPATMGAPYMDYIIADAIVIPEPSRENFAEKVVYLPHCYQPNDRKRPGTRTLTRTECGLPEEAIVFVCFNNSHKLNPEMFAIWMRLLKRIPESVLWLLKANSSVERNLKREVEAAGAAPDRLLFAPMVGLDEHLSRLRLADLFLDTLPHNAHTTASDALWCGVPVLTCAGETFAGRVAASLLSAVQLPELIMQSLDAYERRALELGQDRALLAACKRKLADRRKDAPLFDTPVFARHLESAYTTMAERTRHGLAPKSFRIGADGSSHDG